MTFQPPRPLSAPVDRPAHGINSMEQIEMSFGFDRTALTSEEAERKWFANLLWQAFPMCRSENDLCERAASVLSGKNRNVTPRAVRNWLRCENSPHFRFVLTVYALAMAEKVARAVSP